MHPLWLIRTIPGGAILSLFILVGCAHAQSGTVQQGAAPNEIRQPGEPRIWHGTTDRPRLRGLQSPWRQPPLRMHPGREMAVDQQAGMTIFMASDRHQSPHAAHEAHRRSLFERHNATRDAVRQQQQWHDAHRRALLERHDVIRDRLEAERRSLRERHEMERQAIRERLDHLKDDHHRARIIRNPAAQ